MGPFWAHLDRIWQVGDTIQTVPLSREFDEFRDVGADLKLTTCAD
jgi:hypothetical protein